MSKRLDKLKPPVPGTEVGFWEKISKYYFLYNIFIVLVGLGIIIWGGWMILKGVTGKIDWILELSGSKSSLLNATPGVFLIVVGFLIIIFARTDVEGPLK